MPGAVDRSRFRAAEPRSSWTSTARGVWSTSRFLSASCRGFRSAHSRPATDSKVPDRASGSVVPVDAGSLSSSASRYAPSRLILATYRGARVLHGPAYVANMAPPFLRYWKGWNRPISARWLGEHKTVMGFAAGVLAALLTTGLQSRIPWTGRLVTYDDWLELGLRFGAGAMAGDSIKSFVKRRVGIAPGRPWLPWDQLDFVVGALALVAGRARLSWSDLAVILVLSLVGHIVVTRLAYWIGIRDVKW